MEGEKLIEKLPLSSSWLEDIVDVLLKRPNGEGEIDSIVAALMRTDRDIGAEAESTVTRTINNYCRNSGDAEKKAKHEIFERLAPGCYRLLNYPSRPDLIEIQNIRFDDYAYQKAWELFYKSAAKDERWAAASKRKKLEAFSRSLLSNERLRDFLKACGSEPPEII
ncbi:hypothetical protein [Halomonas sp.]|uniref:hypothetical protein n=1 Tax=Halomonas sp. TaxID=1486246 RepID=UPI00298E1C4F|nr:hypothetical protein [Halomonas sp.]MDW7748710.1 hypothetical protein [Halomonas sp.]